MQVRATSARLKLVWAQGIAKTMKLRPVLLVVAAAVRVLLGTTHFCHDRRAGAVAGTRDSPAARDAGPSGLDLTVASAAPAYDTEEQQNIAVYKKAMPSVVNITSTAVAWDFFYRRRAAAGPGFRLHPEQGRADPDQQPRHRGHDARRVEVTLS